MILFPTTVNGNYDNNNNEVLIKREPLVLPEFGALYTHTHTHTHTHNNNNNNNKREEKKAETAQQQ